MFTTLCAHLSKWQSDRLMGGGRRTGWAESGALCTGVGLVPCRETSGLSPGASAIFQVKNFNEAVF
jgi:hypothetical protein